MTSATRAGRRPQSISGWFAPLRARLSEWVIPVSGEQYAMLGLLVIGLIAHGLNMFHYPAFTFNGDEGIYVSQAWAVLREQRLSPYTYFYDHPPFAWMIAAAWMAITGGPNGFGDVTDGSRILMMLAQLGSLLLLFRIARKFGCSIAPTTVTVLLFSISPLAVFYHRPLLLDNFMVFWLLASLNLLMDGWGRLSRVVLSGICFGLALLSKETAVFVAPVFLYIAFQQRWNHQGRFAVFAWLIPMFVVGSWYVMFATLKGELLPAGYSISLGLFSIGSGAEHVSLIDTVLWQMSRGGGGAFNLENQFWQSVRADWYPRDPILFVGGSIASMLNLIRGIRDRRALAVGLLGAATLFMLARGGLVFQFYIIFAIPFLCLNLGVLLSPLFSRIPARAAGALVFVSTVLLLGAYVRIGSLIPLYIERPDSAGRDALSWIMRNVPSESKIISHDSFWTDLRESDNASFRNVHPHWKVASDPEVRDGVFQGDWRNVDYLIMSAGLERDFVTTDNTVALGALENAHLVRRWTSTVGEEKWHSRQVIELWKVDKPGALEASILADSQSYLSARFQQNGAYQDRDGNVTSEAQSYAMLRAVWSDDRDEFERVWGWTVSNMLRSNGLLSWLWRDGSVVDARSASDADTDAALALLMAGKQWSQPGLIEDGRRLVRAIWRNEIATVNDRPYLTAGDWAIGGSVKTLNPSYFSPHAYHIFQEATPELDWLAVVDSSYRVLFSTASSPLDESVSAGIPPNWVGLNETGEVVTPPVEGGGITNYGYDAARTYWRVAMHLRWFGDGRADAYLKLAGFLKDEVNRKGFVSAVYTHSGGIVEPEPSIVANTGALAALLSLDPAAANQLYAGQFVGAADRNGNLVHWGDAGDLYTQEWGWFATALYAGAMLDLWHVQ